LYGLDTLRGIAAMTVVLFHFTSAFDDAFPAAHFQRAWVSFSGGRYGVQLFFVLSGFVILWSIDRVDRVRDFVVGRFSRLYPPFWVSLAISSLAIPLFGMHELHFTGTALAANVTMLPSWFRQPAISGVYWTLSIEMVFYILLAIFFACRLLTTERVTWTVLGLFLFDMVVIGGAAMARHGFSGLHDQGQDYIHLFVAGMACFLLWQNKARPRWLLWCLFLQAPFVDLLRQRPIPAIVTAAILVVVQLAVTGRLPFLEARPLVFLGKISYSLYLLHMNLGYGIQRWLLQHGVNRNLAIGICVVESVVLAWAMWAAVERRVSPWVRGRLSRRTPKVVPVGA